MFNKRIVIFKNDRGGDLFISLKVISTLKNEFKDITIFLSELNYGFKFLFEKFKIKKVNYNLSLINKINIIIFLIRSDIDSVYILAPKNFYFYLPIIFRNIKFYGIVINGSKRNRPALYLRKFLTNYIEIFRHKIKNKISSRNLQLNLIKDETIIDHQLINLSVPNFLIEQKNIIPNNFIYIQFKKSFFIDFQWGIDEFIKIIDLLLTKNENVLFSSDLEENDFNKFFFNNFSIIDLTSNKIIKRNEKKIFFFK